MQKTTQLICLILVLMLVATNCMARIVPNQAEVDERLHHLINKLEGDVYCGNATIDITGCIDNDCIDITNNISACFYIDARNYCANATVRICLDNYCANGTIYACTDLGATNAVGVCNAAAVGACNDAGTRIAASNNGAAVAFAACNAAAVGTCATIGRNALARLAADDSGK